MNKSRLLLEPRFLYTLMQQGRSKLSRPKEVSKLKQALAIVFLIITMMLPGACGNTLQTDMGSEEGSRATADSMGNGKDSKSDAQMDENSLFTRNTAISDVIADPVFGDYGKLISLWMRAITMVIRWKA